MNEERRQAFEALWREEYARVFRTAFLVTGDRQEAADVTQEAFARAYERWRTVSHAESPGAWVQRVAVNLAITWRRRQHHTAERREETTLIAGRLTYVGSGWRTIGDEFLALSAAARAREHRRIAREEMTAVS